MRAQNYIGYDVAAESRNNHGVHFSVTHGFESVAKARLHNVLHAVLFGKFLRFCKRRSGYIRCDDLACPVRAYEIIAELSVVATYVRNLAVIHEIGNGGESLVKSYWHQSKSLSFLRRLG